MKQLIEGGFELLAVLFDKIPLLNKLKGYRSVFGFVGLAVCSFLSFKGIGSPELLKAFEIGFGVYAGLALNAKGRDGE